MKLAFPAIAVIGALGLITTAATAQARVSVSVGIATPPVYGHVVIGAPAHYHPAPVIIVERRPHFRRYRRPGLIVVRPVQRHRHHHHRHYSHRYRQYDYD